MVKKLINLFKIKVLGFAECRFCHQAMKYEYASPLRCTNHPVVVEMFYGNTSLSFYRFVLKEKQTYFFLNVDYNNNTYTLVKWEDCNVFKNANFGMSFISGGSNIENITPENASYFIRRIMKLLVFS